MAIKFAPISAADLVRAVAGTVLRGNVDKTITELGDPLDVGPGGVAFIISPSYLREVPRTTSAILVTQQAFAEKIGGLLPDTVELCIACPDAYVGLANFTKILADADPVSDWRIEATATPIHPTASIDPTARLGPGVIVAEHARIGAGTVVLGNAVIGPEAQVGSNCVIYPGVVLYPRTTLGDRVRLHANTVLGSDGFGYAPGPQGAVKIWHLGRVIVGDDVEIGAGTTIDRGTINDTIVENGAKIDNLVQIGHNGHVKAHAYICAQVGLGGNVTVGRGVILAGKVGVADKLEIGDGAMVGPMSGVSKDVKPGEKMMGQQRAVPVLEWRKLVAFYERLPQLYERVKKLEKSLKGNGPSS